MAKSKIETILNAIKPYGASYHDALAVRNAMRVAGLGAARGHVNEALKRTVLACWYDRDVKDMLEVRDGAKVVLRLQHVGKPSKLLRVG